MKKQSEVRTPQGIAPRKTRKPRRCSNQSKRQGELAELAFAHKAASLGFGVAKPYGESERFDFIVRSGRHLWRVQVKSTRSARHRGYGISAQGCRRRTLDVYTKNEIDLLVAYVIPDDAWYVIPIEVTNGCQSLRLYPNGSKRGRCKYEKYREAWWQMKSNRKSGRVKN
jgi:hypothetical protein